MRIETALGPAGVASVDDENSTAGCAAQCVEEDLPRDQRIAGLAALYGDDVAALDIARHEVVIALGIGHSMRRQKDDDGVESAGLLDEVERRENRTLVGLLRLIVRQHLHR